MNKIKIKKVKNNTYRNTLLLFRILYSQDALPKRLTFVRLVTANNNSVIMGFFGCLIHFSYSTVVLLTLCQKLSARKWLQRTSWMTSPDAKKNPNEGHSDDCVLPCGHM